MLCSPRTVIQEAADAVSLNLEPGFAMMVSMGFLRFVERRSMASC